MSKKIAVHRNFLYVILGIVSVVLILWVVNYVRSEDTKKTIDEQFRALNFSPTLSLKSKIWQKGGLDVSDGWHYQYVSSEDRNTTTEKLKTAFENASCQKPSIEAGDLIYVCDKSKVRFLIYINPLNHNPALSYSDDVAPPQRVVMSAETTNE